MEGTLLVLQADHSPVVMRAESHLQNAPSLMMAAPCAAPTLRRASLSCMLGVRRAEPVAVLHAVRRIPDSGADQGRFRGADDQAAQGLEQPVSVSSSRSGHAGMQDG